MSKPANIVIPIKGLAAGKTRLREALSIDERYSLNSWLTKRTLRTAAEISGPNFLYVVSPDTEVEALANEVDAIFLLQKSTGLNEGLAEAAASLPSLPSLYLAADLPTVTPNDIGLLLELPAIGIAPDVAETGTNALRVPTPTTLTFKFGGMSFHQHRQQATATKIATQIVRTSGLSFDVDTKDDLIQLEGWPS
jgi:2-phospho-L-lactate guanylyltransferase